MQKLLLLYRFGFGSDGSGGLLLNRRRGVAARILDSVFEAFEPFAQALAKFRQPFGAKEQKNNNSYDQQVGRLKEFTHDTFLRGVGLRLAIAASLVKGIVAQTGSGWPESEELSLGLARSFWLRRNLCHHLWHHSANQGTR